MKYCTFQHGNRTSAGVVQGSVVYDLAQAFFRAFNRPHRFRDLLEFLDADGPARLKEVDLGKLRDDRTVAIPLKETRFRAPILRPPKLICVGLNYKAHAAEQKVDPPKAPMLFCKASNVVISPEDAIEIPTALTEQVDYEVELAVVIGVPGFRIGKDDYQKHVLGYTVMNDVSARDLQFGDKQWFRGKTLNTFAPLGPVVVTPDEFDCFNAPISLTVNGEKRQDSNTNDLIFHVPQLVEYISACFPLEAGDVISTGTPAGVAAFMKPPKWLKSGDRVEATIAGIGTLASPVR